MIPRWVQIPAGLFLLALSILCTAGSIAAFVQGFQEHRALLFLVATVLLVGSLWVAVKAVELVRGRQLAGGGLMSPLALRVTAVGTILLGCFGIYTGVRGNGFLVVQGFLYIVFAVNIFRVASARARKSL